MGPKTLFSLLWTLDYYHGRHGRLIFNGMLAYSASTICLWPAQLLAPHAPAALDLNPKP